MSRKASIAVASPNAKLAPKPKRSAKAPWVAGAALETGAASVSSERLRVPLASEESARCNSEYTCRPTRPPPLVRTRKDTHIPELASPNHTGAYESDGRKSARPQATPYGDSAQRVTPKRLAAEAQGHHQA